MGTFQIVHTYTWCIKIEAEDYESASLAACDLQPDKILELDWDGTEVLDENGDPIEKA